VAAEGYRLLVQRRIVVVSELGHSRKLGTAGGAPANAGVGGDGNTWGGSAGV
jgi:hypothetical protein